MQYAASSQKVLDLICGIQPNGCSPKALVEYLGNNPLSPFIFDINITNYEYDFNETVHIKPINTSLKSCNQNINMPYYKAAACGCADCADSCPVPVLPFTSIPCKVGKLNCLDFICIILFCAITIIFLASLLLMSYLFRKANKQKEKLETKGLSLLFR